MKQIFFVLTIVLLCLCYVIGLESHAQSKFEPQHRNKRVKRQQEPDPTDQFFDSVFQIPISTLNAVNGLIKSTRPVIRRARERIQQQYQSWQQQQQQQPTRGRPRPAGRADD